MSSTYYTTGSELRRGVTFGSQLEPGSRITLLLADDDGYAVETHCRVVEVRDRIFAGVGPGASDYVWATVEVAS